MADGISATLANAILASTLNDTAFTSFTFGPVFVQLHTGAPGAAGTTNVAGNSTRVTCGSNPGFTSPSAGATANSNALNWTSVSTTETYTHITMWSASSGGTFLYSGAITASGVTVGDNFQIAAGGISISQTVAS